MLLPGFQAAGRPLPCLILTAGQATACRGDKEASPHCVPDPPRPFMTLPANLRCGQTGESQGTMVPSGKNKHKDTHVEILHRRVAQVVSYN